MIHYSEEVKERILRKIQTEKAEGNQRQIWNQPLHNSELVRCLARDKAAASSAFGQGQNPESKNDRGIKKENKRLKKENEWLRDFLRSTERK